MTPGPSPPSPENKTALPPSAARGQVYETHPFHLISPTSPLLPSCLRLLPPPLTPSRRLNASNAGRLAFLRQSVKGGVLNNRFDLTASVATGERTGTAACGT